MADVKTTENTSTPEMIETESGLRRPEDIIHTPSGDITWAEQVALKEKYPEGIPSTAIKELAKTREEPKTPAPTPREGYKSVTVGGESYLVKEEVSGVSPTTGEPVSTPQYYKQTPSGQLYNVLEPDVKRTERLYGVTGARGDVTPEMVTTEGMRPDEILVAMEEAGANVSTLLQYAQEHPDSLRGAQAGQLKKGIQAQLTLFAEESGESRIAMAGKMGVLPKDFETLPPKLQEAYGQGDEAYNEAIKEYNVSVQRVLAQLNVPKVKVGDSYNLQAAFAAGLESVVLEARDIGLFAPAAVEDAQEAFKVYTQTRAAYDEWAKQFTESELREIESGSYAIPSTLTGEMAPTTKANYDMWVTAGSPSATRMIAISAALEKAPEILRDIATFARDKGVNPKDFVSLYNAGLSVDTLRQAYPGNDEYFDSIEETLTALKPYTEATPTPGVFMLAAGAPRPIIYSPDFVAALSKGAVTPEQLKLLGYSPKFVEDTQTYVKSLQNVVDNLDKGVQITGTGLSRGIGLSGSEAVDLGTAISEAGIDIQGGSGVVTWRNLSDEDKRKVAQVYATYTDPGGLVSSMYRSLSQITTAEKLPSAAKIGLTLVTVPFTALLTPFAKDITVGELKKQLDNYAVKDVTGVTSGYDLSKYMEDNPYNATLLVRGGFTPEQVESAQKGTGIVANPEGATPLDWLIMGAVTASFVLPVLKGATGFIGRGIVATGQRTGLGLNIFGQITLKGTEAIYVSAALGQKVLQWGFPVGMTIADVAYWKDWTPEQRVIAGIFTGLSYLPILPTIIRTGKTGVQFLKTVTSEGGIVPRALTTGYNDLWPVRVPPDYFGGLTEGSRASLRAIVYDPKMSHSTKIAKVAEMLEPINTRPAFLDAVKLAEDLSTYKVSESQLQTPTDALMAVKGMTPQAAQKLIEWAIQNPDFQFKGSVADFLQNVPLLPKDIDGGIVGTGNKAIDRARAAVVKQQIERIVGPNIGVDVSYPGKFPPLPYGWEDMVPPPIEVGGVKFQSLGEQFLRRLQNITAPGVEEARGLMGPDVTTLGQFDFPEGKVGTHEGRVKDFAKFVAETQTAIDYLKIVDAPRATRLQQLLDNFNHYRELTAAGEVKTTTPEIRQRSNKAFIELVEELQYLTLVHGKEMMLVDPNTGGVLSKIVSPAGEVVPGTVFFASRDLQTDIEMLRTRGEWQPTENVVFFSPEAAFDFLINRTTGELGPHAGIIAVRTVPAVDVGPGKSISGPFRYEYIDGKPVVYNELTSRSSFYATKPNVRSLSSDSISEGITGESVTYYSRTATSVPILWTATDAARAKGLGAPSAAETSTLNNMAIKAALADLLHPHINKITTSEVPSQIRTGLLEFYRDTYAWKEASPGEVAEVVRAKTLETQDQAITNLKSRGEALTEENVLDEIQNLQSGELTDTYAKILDVLASKFPEEYTPAEARLFDDFLDIYKSEGKGIVENIKHLISSLETRTQQTLGKEVQREYESAILTTLLDSATKKETFSTPTLKKLYYLNLGKLSAQIAEAALATSLLRIPGPTDTTFVAPTPSMQPTTPGLFEGEVVTPPLLEDSTVAPFIITPPPFPTPTPPSPTPVEVIETITPPETPPTPPITPPITPPTTPPTTPPPPKYPAPLVSVASSAEELAEAYRAGKPVLWWRHGALGKKDVWKAVIEPDKQVNLLTVVGTENLPVKPRKYATGKGSAQATMQWLGDARVRHSGSADLGVVDVYWGPKDGDLRFEGGGVKTDVGQRMPETGRGISVPEGGGGGTIPVRRVSPLKLGTSFQDLLAYVPRDDALRDFIEKDIQLRLSKMRTEEIVEELKQANLSNERLEQIMSYIPDRQRVTVQTRMKPRYYVKVGQGFKFAETSARPITPKLTKARLRAAQTEEEKELYSEEELREMRTQGLGRLTSQPVKKKVSTDRDMSDFLTEIKGL